MNFLSGISGIKFGISF